MPFNKRQIIKQVKLEYSSLGKTFEKQKNKVELKQTGSIFPQNLINNLIRAKLKEITKLHDIIKKMI